MSIVLIFLCISLLLALLYVLSLSGRKGHPGLARLQGWNYAHRGLHSEGVPENSMAAFRTALEKGYGIELDIHLLQDGNLAVIHDHSLLRTAGADIQIESLTTADLENYRLEGTGETIPTFRQVLALFDGKAPLIVELKATSKNYGALVDAAMAQLQDYPGDYCIESFDPRCIYYLKKHYPAVIRGQLTENFLAGKTKLPWIIKFLLTHQLENFLLQPDFVAYKFADRANLGNQIVRKLWGVQGVTWTLRNPQDHKTAVTEGWLPIFENYEP